MLLEAEWKAAIATNQAGSGVDVLSVDRGSPDSAML